ncbi:HYR domain-containing protein [Aequorivita echinoideorum]|uniref:HYR domain-containing protein n=1 Tax=Aequorivita echinoideorum TaxID=1549647 RepID=A0ABS5S8R3_9FLAO|nr:HYR domain-containing protein [Aequorivita echinoideorum]MBT0608804.1 HYR domain-containing protein [Aequorivita echinoideorum]
MKKFYSLFIAMLLSLVSFGQVLNETFDDNSGFTTSTPFFSDGTGDYFGLAGVNDFNGEPTPTQLKAYTGFTGGFLTGMDLDGEGASLPIIIDWTGLDIDELSDLTFSGEFAEFFDTPGDIDDNDFIIVEYQIDGGGYQNLIAFAGADFTGGGGNANGNFREDTDFDGLGDGNLLTDASQVFTKTIVGTGLLLDLRVTVSVDSGDEDFAIDSFNINGTAPNDITPPVITCPTNITQDNDLGICGAVVTFDAATATDDVDPNPIVTQTGGPESGDEFPVGETTVTFTATDAAGNVSTCSFTVTVEDVEAPVVTCPGLQTVSADENGMYEIPDYIGDGLVTIEDNCATEFTTTQSPVAGTMVAEGTTTVIIEASDDAGNTAGCSFDLLVEPFLGVNDIDLAQVSLFPNPAKNRVTVNTDVENITVYNVLGQQVLVSETNTFQVNTLSKGAYLVKITTLNGSAVKQLIVE